MDAEHRATSDIAQSTRPRYPTPPLYQDMHSMHTQPVMHYAHPQQEATIDSPLYASPYVARPSQPMDLSTSSPSTTPQPQPSQQDTSHDYPSTSHRIRNEPRSQSSMPFPPAFGKEAAFTTFWSQNINSILAPLDRGITVHVTNSPEAQCGPQCSFWTPPTQHRLSAPSPKQAPQDQTVPETSIAHAPPQWDQDQWSPRY